MEPAKMAEIAAMYEQRLRKRCRSFWNISCLQVYIVYWYIYASKKHVRYIVSALALDKNKILDDVELEEKLKQDVVKRMKRVVYRWKPVE